MNDQQQISELRDVLTACNDGLGNYVPREKGDSAEHLLCEILHLVTDGNNGDPWQGVDGLPATRQRLGE